MNKLLVLDKDRIQKKSDGKILFILARHFLVFLCYSLTIFTLSFYKCFSSDFRPTSLINEDWFICSMTLQSISTEPYLGWFYLCLIGDANKDDFSRLDYFS